MKRSPLADFLAKQGEPHAVAIQRVRFRARSKHVVKLPTKPLDAGRLRELVGGLHWYALRVVPQKEAVAQEILARHGVVSYCPSDKRWRRKNRYAKKKDLMAYALMPGYVFAGFEPGIPLWFDLFGISVILGCVGIDGEPKRIPKGNIERMLNRYKNGLERPTEERFMRTYKEFKAGDVVRITEGPFIDWEVPVVEIKGKDARILIELFGSQQEVEMPAWILEPAA